MPDLRNRFYLATIADDAAMLARRYGLGLELDQFCTADNLDRQFPVWDEQARAQLDGVRRALLHAPFAELHPCAIDPLVRMVARKRFDQAADVCRRYGINRMVVHSGFIPNIYFPAWFVEQSAQFFRDFLAGQPDSFYICIENVLDPDPAPLKDLIQAIDDPRAQLCLDVGHAHIVSRISVREWIRTLGGHIGHFHLHDNRGSEDLHLVPGNGNIGFPGLLYEILSDVPRATWTFECLNAEACTRWLCDNGLL